MTQFLSTDAPAKRSAYRLAHWAMSSIAIPPDWAYIRGPITATPSAENAIGDDTLERTRANSAADISAGNIYGSDTIIQIT